MVVVSDACNTTTWDELFFGLNVTNLTYTLGFSIPVAIQILNQIKDNASKTYGNLDGYA